ncbi:hypothetical protein [Lysinibacillus xylanilyticus]|uniref:hypothetical protein n=1 Tax=Lysinibacillus xylanilyticus TaxID=582475 RepID=UPI003CFDE5AD
MDDEAGVCKATTKSKNNIGEFFIQQGDFFVSRGNTVDLVGLGSVVETEITEEIIYPDLYIRLRLDENVINKKYLALLFNSFFGRVYFKYVSDQIKIIRKIEDKQNQLKMLIEEEIREN